MKHQGKVALVTGGTRGIGKAISRRLAEDGADIILNYKSDSATAEETADELRALGRKVWVFQADMRDDKAIRGLAKQVKTEVGQLDILVHNAAFGTMGSILRMGLFSWKAAMDINVGPILAVIGAAGFVIAFAVTGVIFRCTLPITKPKISFEITYLVADASPSTT